MAGIVLAGGKSRRMGADKALLPYGGATLIERVIAVLYEVDPNVLVVADRTDRFRLPDSVQVVTDLFPGAGPLGGIVTGLTHAPEGYHVVVACDMPGLRADVLRLLVDAAQGHDAAVPVLSIQDVPVTNPQSAIRNPQSDQSAIRNPQSLEPLCAAYNRRCLEPLRLALESGCRAVHRALESLHLRPVSEEAIRRIDPTLACFTNVNDPADWQALLDTKLDSALDTKGA